MHDTSCLLFNNSLAGQRHVYSLIFDNGFYYNNLQLMSSAGNTDLYGILCETCKCLVTELLPLIYMWHRQNFYKTT